jgi:hypothetical protein
MMKKYLSLTLLTCLALLVSQAMAPALSYAPVFPELIPLPLGFGPEGITVGNGSTFYVGSLAAATLGQILVGDLRLVFNNKDDELKTENGWVKSEQPRRVKSRVVYFRI